MLNGSCRVFLLSNMMFLLVGCVSNAGVHDRAAPPTSPLSHQTAYTNLTGLSLLHGGHIYDVTGTSMLPTFGHGSLILARREPFSSIRVGQLIVWDQNGETIFHRVVEVSSESVLTKGDSNRVVDRTWVTPESYLGTVFAVNYYATH